MTEKLLQAEKGYARLAQADPAQQQVQVKEGFSAAYAPIVLPSQIQSETGVYAYVLYGCIVRSSWLVCGPGAGKVHELFHSNLSFQLTTTTFSTLIIHRPIDVLGVSQLSLAL